MTVQREFVSAASPTMGRAGAGGQPCQGVWHHPGGVVRTAFIATHYEVDFSEHYLADYLAERGFGFLGWNTRYRGVGHYFALEQALIDIGVGVRWLREVARAERVVLLGNSGGASLMAAYQSQALDPNIHAVGGGPVPPAAEELAPADLFVSLNAHPGRPDVLTDWLDPSVSDETDPLSTDPSLDMFDPAHGPPYDSAFLSRYRDGQVARNHRITAWCKEELARLGGAGAYDRMFAVPRTWADPRFLDLSIDPSNRPQGCYFGDPRIANRAPIGLAASCTLRGWLSMWSLSDSQCRAEPHLARISQPALVVQSDADQGCHPSDARAIYEALGSKDKDIQAIAGDHYLREPVGGRETAADLIADWTRARC